MAADQHRQLCFLSGPIHQAVGTGAVLAHQLQKMHVEVGSQVHVVHEVSAGSLSAPAPAEEDCGRLLSEAAPAGHSIRYRLATILATHWDEFVTANKGWVRPVVFETVRRLLA